MSTPMGEKEQFPFPAFEPYNLVNPSSSSGEDGTMFEEQAQEGPHRLRLNTHPSYADAEGEDQEDFRVPSRHSAVPSPSERASARRLDDELEMLRVERGVSDAEGESNSGRSRSKSINHTRSRTAIEPEDDFDIGTTPLHEKTKIYQPPTAPATKVAKFFKRVHESSWLVRYFCYITPVTLIILIPLLLGALLFDGTHAAEANVGGVKLLWFCIWLEIIWLSLWGGRILAKCIPYPLGLLSSIFTNNSKKWRDLGKQLELPATLFFWWLAVEISFLPTMKHHHISGNFATKEWELTANKVFISVFVGTTLNFAEKIIIQLIAISFHLRTYADRIELNKFQIMSLVKLYIYSKEKIAMDDSEFEDKTASGRASGARTPMVHVKRAQKGALQVFAKVGDAAGKVAGDFTGRKVTGSTHPHQVVLQLLGSTTGSQILARRLYRTFAHEDSETVLSDDLRPAFENDDEANAAFTMFDKDLNGDISMEELEAVCVEIGRERKSITASLKDLDSVVSKLDDVFMFIVIIIVILVLISLISTSAYGVLTSLGSTVLALSWLFSATAQEFLQSCIFVFVKHPFDVGDRVKVYGNQAVTGQGDDYFVKEISLLYTEFKKMEGHVVQAPNSYLNTLFILNQRRSGGLAEAVPITIKFGTTLQQIEGLRDRLLEFVGSENREYQKNILTELTTVTEAYSISLNVVFFYKSNWQNELLRLQRRNKFICALMVSMQEVGIEGPRTLLAGQKPDNPVFLHNAYPPPYSQITRDDQSPGPGPKSGTLARESPIVPGPDDNSPHHFNTHPSILRNHGNSGMRMRGESIGAMGKRVDFSLGMSSAISEGAEMGDVFEKPRFKIPPPFKSQSTVAGRRSHDSGNDRDANGSLLGRTASRDSGGRSVETSGSRRNRFFGRNRSRMHHVSGQDGSELSDLGRGGLALGDIPETGGFDGEGGLVGRPRRGTETDARGRDGFAPEGSGRIDPRTGLVSPQAVAGNGGEGPSTARIKRAATGW